MFLYMRDVKLSFPNNNIKKIHTLNFYPQYHSFDQLSGEWPILEVEIKREKFWLMYVVCLN